jgi:hypothetical protein
MSHIWRTTVFTVAALTVAAVGAVDAGRDRNGDLFTVFLLIAALQVAVLVGRPPRDRRTITLRRDLAEWIDDQARHTGDTSEQVVDRMTAQYQVLWEPEA